MGLSQRAYAKHRGVSSTAVRKALATGRITAESDGTIDPERADRDWDASTDLSKPKNSVTGDPNRGAGAAAEISADGMAVAASFNSSRAKREGWNARKAELDVRRREGELIEADGVQREGYETARTARDALLSIPDRIAAVLAGRTEDECHQILTKEIHRVCAELAKPLSYGPPVENPESDKPN